MNTWEIAIAWCLATCVALAPASGHGKPEHGGQIVEVQKHQFELVVEPEAGGAHLDLLISDPQDKPVTNASVQVQVAGPDGRKTLLQVRRRALHGPADPGNKRQLQSRRAGGDREQKAQLPLRLL